ncbi:MAG: DNA polymerase III subunit delta [Candidatus Peribacteraceae bacterium]|jgi:DNA polymerase-3 subunit delta
MAASLFYFTGGNAFAVREEKRAWQKQFEEKHGPENLVVLQALDVKYRTLLDEVSVAPFIAGKRLLIIEGTPSFTKEEVELLLGSIHPDCVLVIADAHPDKRLSAVKALLKAAQVKEFTVLDGKRLGQWMATYAATHHGSFAPGAAEHLVTFVGEDQDALAQEIVKLVTYAGDRPVTKEDVDALAVSSGEQEVWKLTNLLGEGKGDEALRYARRLLAHGEDPFSLWSILLWMLRTLVTVTAAVKAGERNPAKIASVYKVPFPSARNLLRLAQDVPLASLQALLVWATDTDKALKTGGFKSTKEAPEELLALIDQFIVRSAKLVV